MIVDQLPNAVRTNWPGHLARSMLTGQTQIPKPLLTKCLARSVRELVRSHWLYSPTLLHTTRDRTACCGRVCWFSTASAFSYELCINTFFILFSKLASLESAAFSLLAPSRSRTRRRSKCPSRHSLHLLSYPVPIQPLLPSMMTSSG